MKIEPSTAVDLFIGAVILVVLYALWRMVQEIDLGEDGNDLDGE